MWIRHTHPSHPLSWVICILALQPNGYLDSEVPYMQHSILFVFNLTPDHDFLHELQFEQSEIQSALQPATDAGTIRLVTVENISNAEIAKVLSRYPGRVTIFHFGGHIHAAGLTARGETVIPGGWARLLRRREQMWHSSITTPCGQTPKMWKKLSWQQSLGIQAYSSKQTEKALTLINLHGLVALFFH